MTPIAITRPFTIVIQQDVVDDTVWCASIVGPDVDFVTCADNPVDAAYMAYDVLRMATDRCMPMDITPHSWTVATKLDDGTPATGCSRCGSRRARRDPL